MNESTPKTASVSLPEDLAERQRQLEELDYANRCFTQALNSPQHVLYRLNVQKGCYDYLSPAFEQFTGYPVAEFKNTSLEKLKDYFHPDDRERIFAEIDEAFRTRTATTVNFDLKYRLRKADGGYCWLHDSTTAWFSEQGELECFFGSAHDITAAKQIEKEREQFYLFFMTSSDIMCIVDPDGAFIKTNPACSEILGYSEAELQSKPFSDFVHPDDRQQTVDEWKRQLKSGNTINFENRYICKDGSLRWLSWRAVCNRAENITYATARDITGQKQEEEKRRSLEQQILHTQKLESLGVMAGGIAHDFNNILTAIIGNADLALKRLSQDTPAIENLQRIRNAAGRAADLAQQMLAYSGKGKFLVETIDLNRLVDELVNLLNVSISKNASLQYHLTRPLPLVDADATQIRQILMNLVINASEAIENRCGVITISTGYMHYDAEYLQEVWMTEPLPEGLYVFVEVADTGCGMDRETLDRIFDPFFTTKFTGRGLGMAAVQGIVKGHKGSIKIDSEPDRGTTFKVLLPASPRQAAEFDVATQEQEWKGEGKVLLVDDEETVRQVATEMLKELGFSTVAAADGREAVDIYRNTPDIDFVLLDLTMPNMGGEQCFRELRRMDPQIRVIISSGFSGHEVTRDFAGKGLAGFIQKPYRLSSLRETIRRLGARQTQENPAGDRS